MKIMQKNRFIAFLLAVALLLSLSACGRGKQDDTAPPVTNPPSPAETDPVETEPVETAPPETEPVETEPTVSETAEPETTETEPVETAPVETEPLCEHKFYPNAKTVNPTCKEEGYKEYTCELCGEKVKKDIKPMVDHLYVTSIIESASCTSDGLEATVCTYCGETKKDAYQDEAATHKGIISYNEPITVNGMSKDLLEGEDFYNGIFSPEENEMFWLSFTLKPIELSSFTTAEGGSTLLKFQVGKNTHRIMLRAYRVDERSVKIMCQDSAGKSYELAGGTVLSEGEAYNFVIEYEIKTQKYNIYLIISLLTVLLL